MRLEMLISAVNVNPSELLHKMKIECDAVLVNQCDRDGEEQLKVNDCNVKVLHRKERGIGKSRNLALEHATGDILLFCDEDLEYETGYAAGIVAEFEKHPQADMLLLNLRVCEERRTYWNETFHKIRWYNRGRYGACCVAVRREKLRMAGVLFSELFGGGARYSNGEDSLFLKECAKAGIKMYASDFLIATEIPGESTWFSGYHEKFFFDRGVLFAFLYGPWAWLWALRFALTKRSMLQGEIGSRQAFRLMLNGIRQGKIEKKSLRT